MESREPPTDHGMPPVIDDRYEMLTLLHLGSTSAVYLVADRVLGGDRMALKVYFPPHRGGPGTSRFFEEVNIGRGMNHPRIARVYWYGFTRFHGAQVPYLAMDYVAGRSLDRLLSACGQLTVPQATAVLRQIADALAHAHARGIAHRDLNPSNVLLGDDGLIKIIDLSSACRLSESVRGTVPCDGAKGTNGFSAPETFDGVIDRRSDIFSFGMLALMMCLRLDRPPPDERHRRRLTRQLRAPIWYKRLIGRCCRDDPRRRFGCFEEVIDLLPAGRPRAGARGR